MNKAMGSFSAGWAAILFAAVLLSILSTVPIAAQEKEAQGKQEQQVLELGAITVTAQKQEENVQKVPMSVSVMTDLDVGDRKIESVLDIADHVPNLMIFSLAMPGINTPSMRGIFALSEAFSVSTGLYVDGVPEVTGVGFEEEMLDIQRIEVLRGPQGTLYGKGTEAGAINIVTRPPDNDFRGKIALEVGEDDKRKASFTLSGPVLENRFYYGLSGLYYSKDGFIENTTTGEMVNDRQHVFGKALLRWTPTDRMDISLSVARLEYDEGGPDMNLGEAGAQMFSLPSPEDRKVTSNLEGWNKSSKDNQYLKIAYKFSDSLTLSSITTHRKYHQYTATDSDGSYLTIAHSYADILYDTITQEFRMNYANGRLKGLVGLYFDQDDFEINNKFDYGYVVSKTNRQIEGKTSAVFANLTYPVATRLDLVTGLRYETEEKALTDENMILDLDDSWQQVTPKIALEYSFTPEVMTYVSASKGYRAGGFNALAVSNVQYLTYDAETLWSYELGTKNILLDKKLIINGAIYYMDIKDMQVNEQVTLSESYITNAATATGTGVELEVTAQVTDSLKLNASLGLNDTVFNDFSDTEGDYKGNKNPFAPEYTYSFGGQYRHHNGIYARADLIGYGKMYFDKANEYSRDAYEIVNTKVGYEINSFDVYLYAKNLFDQKYDSDEYYGGYYTIYSPPREIGLQVAYRF